MKNKSIVVTGGGTGGHLSIAKVLIDNFKKRDIKVIYIGSTRGQDKKYFDNSDILQLKFTMTVLFVDFETKEIILDLGVGAKTNIGYGKFKDQNKS